MKRLITVICVTMVLFISSCGKTTCLNPGVRVTFKGYDTIELSRVLVEQYVHNGNFSTLIGVRVYDTANLDILQSNDTTYMPKIDTSGAYIAPGYDYIVSVPGVKNSFFADSMFKISNISYTQIKRNASGSVGCTNDASYYLDSLPHKTTGGSYAQSNLPPVTIVLNK